jgi:hypothetical protein
MSAQYISAAKRQRVAIFSDYRCCYCQTSQKIIGPFLEIDHIVPEAKGRTSEDENLALACPMCNSHKADRTEAVDPVTKETVRLFHPRHDHWNDHFAWMENGAMIIGLTAIGRATIDALQMNHPDIIIVRQLWAKVGWHPR